MELEEVEELEEVKVVKQLLIKEEHLFLINLKLDSYKRLLQDDDWPKQTRRLLPQLLLLTLLTLVIWLLKNYLNHLLTILTYFSSQIQLSRLMIMPHRLFY